MPIDPLVQGLAGFVGGASTGFANQRNIQQQNQRQDTLLNRQRQFQVQDRDTARANKLTDLALDKWLGLADAAGYTKAKTKEDQDKIASQVDMAFSKIPVYGQLLPMVKHRMEQQAQAPVAQNDGQTNFGNMFNDWTENSIPNIPYRAAREGVQWGLSKPGTFQPSGQRVLGGDLNNVINKFKPKLPVYPEMNF